MADTRESGSDSEWAIVDEAPSLQVASDDSKYVFRGDIPGMAGDRGMGEFSDGESIEIVPDDRDEEALEAVADAQEQEQPLSLEREEQAYSNDENAFVANLSRDRDAVFVAPREPKAKLNDRDHWDLVAILVVALVGGFAVGFYCGSAGAASGRPVSADLVQNLRSEIRLLRSAFDSLQLAATATDDAQHGLPLAAVDDDSSLRSLPLAAPDIRQLYSDFTRFQCRWHNDCLHGNAFCLARTVAHGNIQTQPEFFANQGHKNLLEAKDGISPLAGDSPQEGHQVMNPTEAETRGKDTEKPLKPANEGYRMTLQSSNGHSTDSVGQADSENIINLAAKHLLNHTNTEDALKPPTLLETLTQLAALLAPGANLTTLTEAASVSAKVQPGAVKAEIDFAALFDRRVVKLVSRLQSLQRRIADKAGRAIAAAVADLAAARGRLRGKTGKKSLSHPEKNPDKQEGGEGTRLSSKKQSRREESTRDRNKPKGEVNRKKESDKITVDKKANAMKSDEWKEEKKEDKKKLEERKEGKEGKEEKKEDKKKLEERKEEKKEDKKKLEERKEGKKEDKKKLEERKEGKKEDKKKSWGKSKRGESEEGRSYRTKACDWSDCHRAIKPKGDSGPRRTFNWPAPCESLDSDWPVPCESLDSDWPAPCKSLDSDWPAKNVSWVIARGCGREASRSTHKQSDWLFERAAGRKQQRDWLEPAEKPVRAESKSGKRWLPDRVAAAGKKVREVFREMKERARRWR